MRPPSLALALSDAPRALVDAAALRLTTPLLRRLPRARRQHTVMVLPGFLGDDLGNGPLIRFLRELGYQATGWQQGRNLGVASFDQDRLIATLAALAERGGGQVSLVGHSLGGIYAREIAREASQGIRQVITLGSPFGPGHEDASHASRLYARLNPGSPRGRLNPDPPPVPTTAIYTRADGIVNWRTSRQGGAHPNVHNIEVPGSHIGLNVNPVVWYWVAKKLVQH
ncbi:alpha/beta fold hydrolase [Seongchinamella sediminis]|uniref:Alpha/beta fold hydrolase n=1 Tax=Seongchinamella sediminis TaxID=2283635 RepID=A0A3L7DZV4_9GAMM|nr:alpha/beta fold hydrolase [Seongchinamella sediminis]RLQ22786.1 alpha/beta fold hydrolase [Seongchinamella sediminis]